MEQYDSRVDAYIDKSAPFAKPVLEYIRQVVHEASPLITETIKWGCPFFDYKGPVCQMAAFKEHCAFGFFSRLFSIEDLPSRDILTDFILQAMALNESGVKAGEKKPAAEKKDLVIPDYFIDFLSASAKAMEVFDNFSYSHKKEYAAWIADAKSDATRQKRMETALEWISEGKSRNWKYHR